MAIRQTQKNGSSDVGLRAGEQVRPDLISLSLAPVTQSLRFYADINRSLLDTFFRLIPWGTTPSGGLDDRVQTTSGSERNRRASTAQTLKPVRAAGTQPKPAAKPTAAKHPAAKPTATKRPAAKPTATKRPAAAPTPRRTKSQSAPKKPAGAAAPKAAVKTAGRSKPAATKKAAAPSRPRRAQAGAPKKA